MIKSKIEMIKDNYSIIKEDYYEWKIHNWYNLEINNTINSPNFRIGKLIWYVGENSNEPLLISK